jgi:PadR family transcriptional regulator PadR
MKDSALYPILRRLSENELVETYDRQYQGRNRKYYRITEAGNTRRLVLEEEWKNHVQSIDTIIAKNNCREDVKMS